MLRASFLCAAALGLASAASVHAEEPKKPAVLEKEIEAELAQAQRNRSDPGGATFNFALGVLHFSEALAYRNKLAINQKKTASLEQKLDGLNDTDPKESARLRGALKALRSETASLKAQYASFERFANWNYQSTADSRKHWQGRTKELEAQLADLRAARKQFLERELVLLTKQKEIGPVKYAGTADAAGKRRLRFKDSKGNEILLSAADIVALRTSNAARDLRTVRLNDAAQKLTGELAVTVSTSELKSVRLAGTIELENARWLGFRLPDGKAVLVNPRHLVLIESAGKE